MNNKDFQSGFALGLASGGVVEVVDTTEIDALDDLIDESGVLEDTDGTVTEKVEELIEKVYVEYPLPQDEYVYYRYPPCNEDRYIRINALSIEYGTLNADGYTKIGTMEGVNEGFYYKYIIPAHTKDFIIKLSAMPKYGRSNAVCTEVYCGKSVDLGRRSNSYTFIPTTINGLEKITINGSIQNVQTYGTFRLLPCQTIKFDNVKSIVSYNMFSDCMFLKEIQFEEMVLGSPYDAFRNCASLETIDCSKIVSSGRIDNMFHGCYSLETLDLSSWAEQSSTFTNVNGLFRYCSALKTLNLSGWNLSHITALYDWFDGNSLLENVILDNTILFSATFRVNSCPNLTIESLSAIFDALPTLAEGVTKTLTLNANHKILQSQVDSANAKGWTVAGGTVVKEEEYNG